MRYLTNAFSLGMLKNLPVGIEVVEVSTEEAAKLAPGFTSVVGHADTAAVFAQVLGVPVRADRATVSLGRGDQLLVGQYKGPRLPEGATTLPEGATIVWLRVFIA